MLKEEKLADHYFAAYNFMSEFLDINLVMQAAFENKNVT